MVPQPVGRHSAHVQWKENLRQGQGAEQAAVGLPAGISTSHGRRLR